MIIERNLNRMLLIIRDIEWNGGKTYRAVGEKFGVTAERIRQLYRLGKHLQTEGKLPIETEEQKVKKGGAVVALKAVEFVLVQPGTFDMGEQDHAHRVTISRPFYLQATPVTQSQWVAVMGHNPSYFETGGGECPVERVSWKDVQVFIQKLNQQEGTDKYRLPTEAEWEYAARAGTTTDYSFGDSDADLDEYAWYYENSGEKTHPVGQKKPNPWGLYDMHGNVWEWCQDWYGDYPKGHVTDPTGPSRGSYRVIRGGSWGNGAYYCRSAERGDSSPAYRHFNVGFRLARTP